MNIDVIVNDIIAGKQIDRATAEHLASGQSDLWDLIDGANRIRRRFHGDRVHLCSIINAKSGACKENCQFCAQSAHHDSQVKVYPLVAESEIRAGYARSAEIGAHGYSIVTSGNELTDDELASLSATIQRLSAESPAKPDKPYLCGSLGRLKPEAIQQLKAAGLSKAHHNLETSRRFFSRVCTTHSYDERIETVRNLKQAGLKVCSGGLFGLGEDWSDRIEMAFTLRELAVDSVPLNFLIPIPGTALADVRPLSPHDALRIIALYRYILPATDIRVCAGREKNLGDMQSWIFRAGATGMMIGGYLTQPGRDVADDLKMLKVLGMEY